MKQDFWGMSTSIDLYHCNPDTLRDAKKIKKFTWDLCKLLEVKRFGPTFIVNFGQDPRIAGYSMTQLIETSLVSAHFVNETNAIYLDIFSCKRYDVGQAVAFAKNYFEAREVSYNLLYRY